ncbi:RagB/SusD family nutrient uptake outer membrane protein [Mucilaginibacter sp. Bleaf8]|uniref:RagB/SusD family nutrient uptake outer membrane protein n=1 Tax=Mucilaginibacter sp. Bleaf8 TaxID=2834430 RepID=UPI001BCA701B|nr:RagB/SusD family nutrient uptake outer membrane protein [Mucilaginibacter sp. Bleaf8]MBS7564087.1 RagB/SusD family nutrient uptake outer membrane protein [Mucilaginibacter sp. Bleaf8]
MKIIKSYKALLLVLLVTVASCKKLDLAPTDAFTEENYWTTAEKANAVVNTAYNQMFNNNDNNGSRSSNYFFLNEALSDNAVNTRGDNEGVASIAAGIYDPSLGRFKAEWANHYAAIRTCNIFMENIDKVTNMDAALRDRMKGEIRFIRAFQYFQLYTWFGDVPLILKVLTREESNVVSRTPRAEVLKFVLSELDEATKLLPLNTTYGDNDKGRIAKGTAIALKARVLLYEGRWQEVVTACEQLMSGSNGTYSLFPSYEGLFLPQNENNSEVMLDVQYVLGTTRNYSNFFDYAPLSVGARLNSFSPTQELVNSYIMLNGKAINEAGSGYNENDPYTSRDPRLTNTVVYHGYQWKLPDNKIKTIYTKPGTDPDKDHPDEYAPGSVSSPTGYYLRKYYDPTSLANFQSGLNLILIRYADVLLMYAEAKNELNQFTSDDWDKTIKALRTRAGFTDAAALNYNGGGQTALRNTIRNERRTELAMEGLRIFDIRRWRIAENVLNGWAHGAKYGPASVDNGYLRVNQRSFDPGKHYLWPIPRDERNLNPNLTQNPGW